MQNVDILIPLFVDNDDRLKNLNKIIEVLSKYPNFNLYIREYFIDNPLASNLENVIYSSKKIEEDFFNKMACVNEMFESSTSEIIAIYDVDVLVFKNSLQLAIDMLNFDYDVVYPYNGCFYNIPKKYLNEFLGGGVDLSKTILWNSNSYGGCVLFKREVFKNGGRCNPNFKNVGYDDNEIYIRFKKLGYNIGRTSDPLLHMDHDRSHTAFGNNKYENYNAGICSKISNMSKEELIKEIEKW